MASRRYLEGSRDEAFNRAISMWEHPHRILEPDLSNAQRIFRIPHTDVYAVPNTRILRGLQNLGVLNDMFFSPIKFKRAIIERRVPFADINSDESFTWLGYRYMHAPVHGTRSAYSLKTPTGDVFEFPLNDVYDLPAMLFMYILDIVTSLEEGGVYHIMFSLDPVDDIREQMKVIGTLSKNRSHGGIPIQSIVHIYNAILSSIYNSIHGYDHIAERSTWNGSDESGTRIIVKLKNGEKVVLRVRLVLRPGIAISPGGRWTRWIQALLDNLFKTRCYLTVKNEQDNLCLVYCIMLGVMCHEKELWMTREDKTIPSETITCRALYDNSSPEELQIIAKSLLEGEDPIEGLGIRCGEELSVKDFQFRMKQVEEKLLYGKLECYALDIYLLEYGELKHVYPVYMSKRVDP